MIMKFKLHMNTAYPRDLLDVPNFDKYIKEATINGFFRQLESIITFLSYKSPYNNEYSSTTTCEAILDTSKINGNMGIKVEYPEEVFWNLKVKEAAHEILQKIKSLEAPEIGEGWVAPRKAEEIKDYISFIKNILEEYTSENMKQLNSVANESSIR